MKITAPAPNSLNLPLLEGLYADYVRDPDSVPLEWRDYFREGFRTVKSGSLGAVVSSARPL